MSVLALTILQNKCQFLFAVAVNLGLYVSLCLEFRLFTMGVIAEIIVFSGHVIVRSKVKVNL